jgi:hypothetical protein
MGKISLAISYVQAVKYYIANRSISNGISNPSRHHDAFAIVDNVPKHAVHIDARF